MKDRIIPAVIVITAIAAGIYFGTAGKLDGSKELAEVKIGHLQLVASWPLYAADHENYFQKAGIKPEYVSFQSSNQAMDGLIRGDVQVSYLGSLPVLAAQTTDPNKVKILAFGDYNNENPFDSLLVKNDSPIQSVQDLAGKKIGVFPGTTGTNFMKKYLSDAGVDINKVEFVQLPPSAQLQALSSGAIDALHAYELNTAIAMDQGIAKKLDEAIFAHVLDGSAIGVVAARTEWVNQNPGLAKKVVASYEKALAYGKSHPTETRSIVKEKLSLTDSVAQKVTLLGFIMANDYDYGLFEQLANLSAEIGDLRSKPDVSQLKYTK